MSPPGRGAPEVTSQGRPIRRRSQTAASERGSAVSVAAGSDTLHRLRAARDLQDAPVEPGAGGVGLSVILVAWFGLSWFYGGFFETVWNGQTPGKRLLGLRVLTVEGQPINALQAVLRNADVYRRLYGASEPRR